MLKRIKSFLSLLLSLTLAAGCLAAPADAAGIVLAAEPDVSHGVYQISSADELLWAAEHPDGNYILIQDIDLSEETGWTPIGTEETPFSGSFNGAGHTITVAIEESRPESGIYLVGLFGFVSGTVMNLTVDGTVHAAVNSGYVGGVAANIAGGKITGCTSDVDIDAEGTVGIIHVGGIAGAVRSGNGVGRIENCVNNGGLSVTAKNISGVSGDLGSGTHGAVGGILGYICDTAGAHLAASVNNGDIIVTGGADNVGGIVGQTSTNAAATYVNITYCANKGDVTVYETQGERAAGIIGYVKGGVINYCYNTGNIIEYTDNGSAVARQGYGNYYGIFGYANLGSSNRLEVTYCYNASPNPLEAEICVVRNASYGTFNNFYLSGRTEYETELNAGNVSAGTAGTAFTSASDLYTKITSAEAGAAAYAENPGGGYPILYFETETALSPGDYSGFIEVEQAGSYRHNIYYVFQISGSVDTQGLAVSATLKDGSAVVIQETLSPGGSVKIGDTTYVAAEGCSLYSVVMNSISDDLWTTASVDAREGETTVFTAAVNADDVVNSTGVEIPFEGLPNYPDGIVSPVYNCGPGLAVDKTSVTDEDSKMVVVSSTGEASFTSYVQRLLNKGFTRISESQIDGNRYCTLLNGSQRFYLYYTAYSKQVRIIEDNSTGVLLSELDAAAQGSGTTEFYLYSIDYTHGEGQTAKTDYWQIDCGALIIVKLADNSLFVIDSGHERQSSKAAMDGLMKFLYEITGQQEGSVVDIRGWFFSHAHGDHVYLAHAFIDRYHDSLNVESALFNIPSYQTMSGGYDGGTFLMKESFNAYYPDCKVAKLHTGESFTLQGVRFDVLHTHEDAVNENGVNRISDFNDTSTVLKMTMDGKTFMLLGDANTVCQSDMLNMFGAATLRCDAVQTAHHGYNDLPALYQAIGAPLALFSNSEENAGPNSGNAGKYHNVTSAAEDVTTLFADPDTYKITVENGEIQYVTLPSYRAEINYFTVPDLDESLVPVSTEPAVDLDTVLQKAPLLDFVIDKSVNGTASISTGEPCSLILDGSASTKFCTNTVPAVLAWSMKKPVAVSSYVVYTANDNSKNPGRNPQKWMLCGSNDAENWTVLDAVSSGNLPDTDYTGVAFNVDHPAAYQYYVFKIFSTAGAPVLQLSEIGLYSDDEEPDILPGDVNFDEKVDASDVVELRRLIRSGGATEAQKQAGDLNGDELLTDADATLLLEQLDIVLGDVDGSGNISALDVMVMRKLMLSGGITDAHLAAGDLDGSGELGALDIMRLRKMMLQS